MSISITSILGEVRPIIHSWPDGSHECPFCGYAARPQCDNPACPASKYATAANRPRFEEQARVAVERAEQEAQRKRNHEWAMRRIAETQAREAAERIAWAQQVREVGGCLRCSERYQGKIRRHRGECPKGSK